jgi:uncharacterized LabA/DUF88 family protein
MENNFAFIDSQNLNLGVLKDVYKNGLLVHYGWKLDFKKLRIYLQEKYSVTKAFLCIGHVPGNESLYTELQQYDYICIFKPTLFLPNGSVKGNVDAELVLQSMIEYDNYDKAVIVSGDGDFYCLAKHLLEKDKLKIILAPNEFNYSSLLNKLESEDVTVLNFINQHKNKLEKRL